MDGLVRDLSAELATRILATALIVIGITLAVERLGPKVGGALVGLPIVIGPGFFFLIREHGPAFSAEAAAFSLVSLCATEAFLLAYCASAARLPPGASLAAATVAWLASALLLSNLPPRPVLGLALFVAAVVAARRTTARFVATGRARRVRGGAFLLAIRGLAAGLLVAAATLAAERLGPGWSGLILAFPIGFTVVSITIHQRSGPDTAIATLHAATLGVASLAAFSFTLSVAIVPMGAAIAFIAALAAGVLVTAALTWRSALLRGTSTSPDGSGASSGGRDWRP